MARIGQHLKLESIKAMAPPSATRKRGIESDSDASTSSTAGYYDRNAEEYFKQTAEADLSVLYERFLPMVRPGGSILDAGSGSGRDLLRFREKGFKAIGIDVSNALVQLARTYAGVPCHQMRLEDVKYVERFDAVWACASLLHLPKSALVEVIRRLGGALKTGGVIFASMQIGSGEGYLADGRYYAYYQPAEFRRLMQTSGLIIEQDWTSQDSLGRQTPVQWFNVIARRMLPGKSNR